MRTGGSHSSEHWFDALSKRVAAVALSRRSVIGSGGVATLMRLAGGAHAQPASPAGGCALIRRGNEVTLTTSGEAEVAGSRLLLSLQMTRRYDQVRRISNSATGGSVAFDTTLTITLGDQTLLTTHSTGADQLGNPQSSTASTSFRHGSQIGGASGQISLRGGQFEGTVNGRAIRPVALGTHVESTTDIRFSDGMAPPRVTIDPAITTGIQNLAERLRQKSSQCLFSQNTAAPRQLPLQPRPGTTPIQVASSISDRQWPICDACVGSCNRDEAICTGAAAAAYRNLRFYLRDWLRCWGRGDCSLPGYLSWMCRFVCGLQRLLPDTLHHDRDSH
jgi:hypothetical protein